MTDERIVENRNNGEESDNKSKHKQHAVASRHNHTDMANNSGNTYVSADLEECQDLVDKALGGREVSCLGIQNSGVAASCREESGIGVENVGKANE